MPRSNQINHDCAPNIRHEPRYFVINASKSSFSTPKYESRAREILLRDKEAKIEKRASLRRFVMPKSKRSTFSQRDIFWTISLPMDMRQPDPEWLKDSWGKSIKEGGDINPVP
jgi:hypothetical protein